MRHQVDVLHRHLKTPQLPWAAPPRLLTHAQPCQLPPIISPRELTEAEIAELRSFGAG